jgi:hypothetical protein
MVPVQNNDLIRRRISPNQKPFLMEGFLFFKTAQPRRSPSNPQEMQIAFAPPEGVISLAQMGQRRTVSASFLSTDASAGRSNSIPPLYARAP